MKTLTATAAALALLFATAPAADAQYSRKDYPSRGTSTTTSSRTTTAGTPSRTQPTSTSGSERLEERADTRPTTTPVPSRTSGTASRNRPTSADERADARTPSTTSPRPAPRVTAPEPYYEPERPSTWGDGGNGTWSTRTTERGGGVYTGTMTRREREDLQARLLRRQDRLIDWTLQLERREIDLYGRVVDRGYRATRYDDRYLLSERQLCDWAADLDAEGDYLADREERILRAAARDDRWDRRDDRRDDRGRRNRGRGNGNGNGNMCPPGW